MSELKATPCENSSYSIAGKVFLLGEYAVLAGLPAVVAAVGPRFQVSLELGSSLSPLAPKGSPLDRLFQWETGAQKKKAIPLRFFDPHDGAGGFGASTAEFALAYQAYQQKDPGWKNLWMLYRELMSKDLSENQTPPSGADLVAQWQGGIVFFDPQGPHCMDLWPLMDWSGVLIFSATGIPGRKLATHLHLKNISLKDIESAVEPALAAGVAAIREGSPERLGKAMVAYADVLSELGFESEQANADRKELLKQPGVLGVKGCGAMLTDAVVVVVGPNPENRERVIELARSRGLRLIADGLGCEMGITCQK
ncbi:MAG: hypothetical protein HYX41_05025 [Bdellovibrio sp.]|nr:hypothetical protein [Bdellovibrio sp.]